MPVYVNLENVTLQSPRILSIQLITDCLNPVWSYF